MVLTVSQLNLYAKSLLEGDERLRHVFLRGEISNFTNHYRSGHLYMSLKDEGAALHAVMFRGSAVHLRFTPCDGMKVIASGRVSLYERDGQFQFYIDDMQPDGVGALYMAYEQLKRKLEQEGLFDPARKRPLPRFPCTVGVITSKQGAALQDILHILARRWPLAQVVLFPVPVQGEGAAGRIAAAVRKAGALAAADVLIVGRGGGSLEDLWAFNDEGLARAIASCEIPVVSAVGHETDFTIADFAADVRAPTPSAAAELVSPDAAEVRLQVKGLRAQIEHQMLSGLAQRRELLRSFMAARALKAPLFPIELRRMRLDNVVTAFQTVVSMQNARKRLLLSGLAARLDALSPLKILSRGYAAVFGPDGKPVESAAVLQEGERLRLRFADGSANATVTGKESGAGIQPGKNLFSRPDV